MKIINLKLSTIIIIVAIVIITLFVGGKLYQSKINSLENKLESETKLKNALLDTAKVYKNKENEWTTEKLTLQARVGDLENKNNNLTTTQKDLVNRVIEVQKSNSIIAAALIETNVKLSQLTASHVIINSKDTLITFSDSTKNLKYNIEVGHAIPVNKDIKPTLKFLNFDMPNTQFVEFHWKNDKKEGYPVAFSVSNSNDYFKTANIDSYAIPELDKNKIKPNGWQKIGNFFKKSGKTILTVLTAAAAGGGAIYVLTH